MCLSRTVRHQHVSLAVDTIFRVTYKNIMNANSLSNGTSEPLDVTKKVLNVLHSLDVCTVHCVQFIIQTTKCPIYVYKQQYLYRKVPLHVSMYLHHFQGVSSVLCALKLHLRTTPIRHFHILSIVYTVTNLHTSMYCSYNNLTHFTTFKKYNLLIMCNSRLCKLCNFINVIDFVTLAYTIQTVQLIYCVFFGLNNKKIYTFTEYQLIKQ